MDRVLGVTLIAIDLTAAALPVILVEPLTGLRGE